MGAGVKVNGLVDSGANSNAISESFVTKNNLWKYARRVQRNAVTASGHVLEIVGVLSIKSRISLKRNVYTKFIAYIIKGIKYDCYIGLPLISKFKEEIPFEKVKITEGKEELKNMEEISVSSSVPVQDKKEVLLVDQVEFLRLLKNNSGGVMLIQTLEVQGDPSTELNSVDIDVPVSDTETYRNAILEEFKETVTDEPPKFLPPKRKIDHRIVLFEEKSIYRQQYRLSFEERQELDKQVKELLQKGFVRPSASPFNAPVLFVKKKDGTLRLCTDFRLLNEATVKDRFPLPRIDEILDIVGNSRVFSKLDLLSGYFQVRIKEEDIAKTAFSSPTGHFEWVVMPFGLSNAPSTFQRFMNQVLSPYLGKFAMVYLDDIIIYSDSVEKHMEHLRKVLQLLKDNQLIAKMSKCAFLYKQIGFLGFIIGNGEVKTDPGKIEKVKEWPIPLTIKDCQSFLGLTGFYRRFIQDYAKITSPMMQFVTKSVTWGEEQTKAFRVLKDKMINAPVLKAPIFEEGYQFRVTTDASDTCLGFVLEQLDPDGKLLGVVQYGSKKLVKAELNYPVREKEFMAVITALRKFRSYLAYRKFVICTDHYSLVYLKQQKNVNNGRLARWMDFLSQFEFDIQYIKGETNTAADALSRYPEINSLDIEVQDVSVTQVVVSPELEQRILNGYANDPEFGQIYRILSKGLEVPIELRNHIKHFTLVDGIMHYKSNFEETFTRVCIPNVGTLRLDLITQCHDGIAAGHFGYFRTYELISRSFYWNRMIKSVKKFVATCDSCQRSKPTNVATQGLFRPLPVPPGRWTDVTLDFVGALPQTISGYDTIMVVVDRLSKRAHFIPTTKELTAEGAAELFLQNIFKLHGVPHRIVSDKDVRFTARFWRTIHERLGSSILFSTTNHPQTDGQSERTIRTVIQYLRNYCLRDMLGWDKFLFAAEFSYNSTMHDSTKAIPFEVDLGFVPNGPSFISSQNDLRFSNKADEFAEEMKTILRRTQDELVHNQKVVEKRVNQHRTPPDYKVDDWVLVHKDALVYQSSTTYCKLHPAYLGPYKLVKKLNDNAFEVDIPTHVKKHRTINVQWFKHYNRRDEGYPKVPPRTDYEIVARLTEVTGIAGYDYEKRLVYVFWRDCPPGLSSAITYDQFDQIGVSLRSSLLEQAKSLGATRIEDNSSI